MGNFENPRFNINVNEPWYECWLCKPLMYPESDTIVAEDGRRYCKAHYNWRFNRRNVDAAEINIEDNLGR